MPELELFFCDTETTGLDPKLHDVIEISFINGRTEEQKTWNIKPVNFESISMEALAVNETSLEDLMWKTAAGKEKYRLAEDVLPEIENWINESMSNIYNRILVGHNIQFDYNMMKELWGKADAMDTFPFTGYGMLIDTKGLALFFDYVNKQNNSKYNLGACIKKYGVEKRKAHGAENDTKMVADLFKVFAGMVGNE